MKTKKRLVLPVAMLLALLMVAAALSGLGVFLGNGTVYAADATFDTAKAVSVSGATVTAGSDQSGSVTHKGLLISPETSTGEYSGTINALLPANSTIQFSFPGTLISDGGNHNARQLDFTFRFTSASNPDEYFEIFFFNVDWNGWYNSMAVRDSEGNVRTADKNGNYYDTIGGVYPHYPYYGSNDKLSGYITTEVKNGVLTLYIPMVNDDTYWNCPLAQFDSDEYTAIDKGNGICGLKKIDFSNGYTVSFSAKSKGGEVTAPLLIEKINDQSFETATFETEPSWYTDYAAIPQINLTGTVNKVYISSVPFVVPSATYSYPLRGTESFNVAKIELQKDGGEWVTVSAGDKISEIGTYKLRYTAVDGSALTGNTLEKSFSIYKDYYDMSEIVDVNGGTATAGADSSGSVEHKGVLITPNTPKGEYSGKLNTVLPANSTIQFSFPGTLISDGGYHNARQLDFTFRFTSASNPDEWFEIFFFNVDWNGWYNSMAVRDSEGNVRTADKNGIYYDTIGGVYPHYPYYGSNDKLSGFITTRVQNGVLALYIPMVDGDTYWNCPLAKFDSDEYTAIDNGNGICGLKKIDFSNGYTVSFSAKSKDGENTAPLMIEKINDLSLADNTWVSPEDMTYTGMEYVSGSDQIKVAVSGDETLEQLGFGAIYKYNVAIGGLTFNGNRVVYPEETVDLTRDNVATLTYSFLGQTFSQTATVLVKYTATVDGETSGEVTYTSEDDLTAKLAELAALLPANTPAYTYAWASALPEVLPLENATYTVVKTAVEYTATVDGEVTATIKYTVENKAEKLAELIALLPESTVEYAYAWSSELPAELPLDNATYTVIKTAVEYTITFVGADGVNPIRFTVETIGSVVFPAVPEKQGYSDGVWDKTASDLALENTTVTAVYKVGNIYGASISLEGEIALNFYLSLSDATLADADAYVSFVFDGAETKVKLSDGVKNGSYYVFTFFVAAKDCENKITMTVCATEGEGVSAEYSVKEYINAVSSGDYSQAAKDLVASLSDYCDAAKAYFSGQEAEPAFEEVTKDTVSKYAAVVEGTEPDGVTIIGASLVLDGKTSIRVYFTGDNAASVSVKVNGEAVLAKVLEQNGKTYYYVEIANIVAKDLDTSYAIEIGTFKVTYSAMSYVEANISSVNTALVNVLKSMYIYNVKADAYAESNSSAQ